MGTKTFWLPVYRQAIDENEDLERRWEALRKLRNREIYNPHLGDLEVFIQENGGLVVDVVKKSMAKTKYKVEFDDLMQEGWIGFIKAYARYTPEKSTKFSTYAYYYMSNEIMRFIADKVPMIRVPNYLYELGGRILRNKLGESTAEEIAERLGCTVGAASRALENLRGNMVMSLNTVLTTDKTSHRKVELMDILENFQDFSESDVQEFIDSLSNDMKKTLELALENKSQKEIGKELGFSQNQASRLLKMVREKATKHFREVTA